MHNLIYRNNFMTLAIKKYLEFQNNITVKFIQVFLQQQGYMLMNKLCVLYIVILK